MELATTPTQIRIDEMTKAEATQLLNGLGMTLSEAVNLFLKQVILRRGIPFDIAYPETVREFKPEVIEAMEEAKCISRDPDMKRHHSFSEAMEK
ncbi:MAG: type II toxin-antitoxin system RelB/DinJ family antitoxin [Ruminococcaceae bacterium]|nr:type II toxin-antitoxin system RelB/DinJ family antitoxin [Oscillospiraceae bacterium]